LIDALTIGGGHITARGGEGCAPIGSSETFVAEPTMRRLTIDGGTFRLTGTHGGVLGIGHAHLNGNSTVEALEIRGGASDIEA
jgi:hypothetical protein